MNTSGAVQTAWREALTLSLRSGAWWVLVTALAIQVALIGKPLHVDDPVVVHIARQILKTPFHPLSGELDWDGWVKPTFEVTTNPPLLSYYLALWMLVGGEREWSLHAAMLIWQPLLWWGVVLLARHSRVSPEWAVAFVLLNAATIVSPNLMRDVPMLALWTLGTAWFLLGSDRGDARLLAVGALVAGCSALMKYSGLGAGVLLGAYVLWQRRRHQLGWVLLALVPFLLWCAHNLLVHGQTHFLATLHRTSAVTPLSDRVWGTVAGLGGIWWLWLWALVACGRWHAVLLGLGSTLAVGWWRWSRFSPAGDVEAAVWSAAGTLLLVLTLFRLWERWREQAFHALWAGWVLLAIGIGAPFAAARHLLPALPPLTLLWLPRERGNWALAAVVAVQAVHGVYAGWCDAQIADVYRRGAQVLAKQHGAEAFIGHWGWMYYAQCAGLRQVSANRLPAAGTRLAIPSMGGDAVVPAALVPRLRYEESVVLTVPAHLATLPPRAGFYAALRGAPPFRWLPEGYQEQFDLFVVEEASP